MAASVGSPMMRQATLPSASQLSSSRASLHSSAPSSSRVASGFARGSKGCVPAKNWPVGAYPSPVIRSRLPPVQPCTTVIWFCVSVPVLSEHTTVAHPSVSTAGSLRMSAWCLIMRCMPSARQIVTIAGNPSGTAAMARLTAIMNRLTMSLRSACR